MHFEPVGWQWEWASGDRSEHYEYAKRNDYNRNLTKVLQTLEYEKKLAIRRAEHDVSVVNSDNPTMLIEWESK